MHQEVHDGDDRRDGMLQKPGENESEYIKSLEEDMKKMKDAFDSAIKTSFNALAYPHGLHSEISEVFLAENGIDITFTTNWGKNEIVKGIPQTLRLLNRISLDNTVSGEMLINIIESAG